MKLEGKLNEATGAYEFNVPDTPEESQVATLEKGMGSLSKAYEFEVAGLPVGNAVVGGATAILGTELVDGIVQKLMPTSATVTVQQQKYVQAGVKVAAGWAIAKYAKKVMGTEGSKFVGALFLFDAMRDATPIDTWMNTLANKVTGFIPAGGLGGQTGMPRTLVNNQAAAVAASRGSVFGGR